jgi:hypothetical protein
MFVEIYTTKTALTSADLADLAIAYQTSSIRP